jgi:hypothetical protein
MEKEWKYNKIVARCGRLPKKESFDVLSEVYNEGEQLYFASFCHGKSQYVNIHRALESKITYALSKLRIFITTYQREKWDTRLGNINYCYLCCQMEISWNRLDLQKFQCNCKQKVFSLEEHFANVDKINERLTKYKIRDEYV